MTTTNVVNFTTPIAVTHGGTGVTDVQAARDALLVPSRVGKNYLIGGNFDTNPWQRGSTIAVGAASVQTVGPDRWMLTNDFTTAGAFEMKKVADAPSMSDTGGIKLTNSLQIKATTTPTLNTNTVVALQQHMESLFSVNITQQPMVLSFWVKSSTIGEYGVSLATDESFQTIWLDSYTINAADTWEFKTITVPAIDSHASHYAYATDPFVALIVSFGLLVGSDYRIFVPDAWLTSIPAIYSSNDAVNPFPDTTTTIKFNCIQLEPGNVFTGISLRTKAHELQLCQRYCEKSYLGDSPSGDNNLVGVSAQTGIRGIVYYMVPKWTLPPVINLISQDEVAGEWLWYDVTGGGPISIATSATTGSQTHFTVSQSVDTTKYKSGIGHYFAEKEPGFVYP